MSRDVPPCSKDLIQRRVADLRNKPEHATCTAVKAQQHLSSGNGSIKTTDRPFHPNREFVDLCGVQVFDDPTLPQVLVRAIILFSVLDYRAFPLIARCSSHPSHVGSCPRCAIGGEPGFVHRQFIATIIGTS